MACVSPACLRLAGGTGRKTTVGSSCCSFAICRSLQNKNELDMEKMNPKGPDDRDEEKDEQDFLGGEPVQQKAPAKHH